MKSNETISIPDILLERYLLDELSPEDSLHVRNAIMQNDELESRLRMIKQSNEAVLNRYPPELFEIAIGEKAKKNKNLNRAYFQGGCSFLALIVVAIIKYPAGVNDLDHVERIKGKTESLSIYKKLPDGYKRLEDQSVVSQGDIIQISYRVTEKLYGTILSVDGNGSVTLHFSENVNESTLLIHGSEHFLKTAYELDNAPEYERFFFITSTGPVFVDSIINAVKKISKTDSTDRASLDIAKNLRQYSYTLKKRALL